MSDASPKRAHVPAAQRLRELREALPPSMGPLRAHERMRRLSADIRLQRNVDLSLQAAPLKAGPLNSQGVVVRALQRLHAISPGYVRAMVGHLDALSAIERL